jgi:hypothetical protein
MSLSDKPIRLANTSLNRSKPFVASGRRPSGGVWGLSSLQGWKWILGPPVTSTATAPDGVQQPKSNLNTIVGSINLLCIKPHCSEWTSSSWLTIVSSSRVPFIFVSFRIMHITTKAQWERSLMWQMSWSSTLSVQVHQPLFKDH